MGVTELLTELEVRGVRLAVEGGRLTARAPQGAVTPELAEQIRGQKPALMAALAPAPTGTLTPLPDALARLVHAAVCDHLNFSAALPAGRIPNLGEYVLSSAALYACNIDPDKQLRDLWAARGAWAA